MLRSEERNRNVVRGQAKFPGSRYSCRVAAKIRIRNMATIRVTSAHRLSLDPPTVRAALNTRADGAFRTG